MARADTATDLKAALEQLVGTGPVRALVEHEFTHRSGDPKKPMIEQGRVTARLAEGPDGLEVTWGRDVLGAAEREQREHSADPERQMPTRRAMENLAATTLHDYLNASTEMVRMLGTAKVTRDTAETRDGAPVRLLELAVDPPLSKQDRKYIRELVATVTIWIGADGFPVAAKREVRVRGRAMLVIGFESTEKEEFRFARVGDRLVVVEHLKDGSGSGGGESSGQRTITRLSLDRA